MTKQRLEQAFKTQFDMVGFVSVGDYNNTVENQSRKINDGYKTMVVVGLSYPSNRIIRHTKKRLVPSIYTFGKDYHSVLKERLEEVCNTINLPHYIGVDSHIIDERHAFMLSGLGYQGKNQLMISELYGTYFFIGIALFEFEIDINNELLSNQCGSCTLCQQACPTKALNKETIYEMDKCISFFNQEKKQLNDFEVNKNLYLFGCDICQVVCPKNIGIQSLIHEPFKLNGNESVDIEELFTLSQKEFKEKYHNPAYLWRGKLILMRNAVTLLYKQKNTVYNDLIKESLQKHQNVSWYYETVSHLLTELERIKENEFKHRVI